MDFTSVLDAPFGRLGVLCRFGALERLEFLDDAHPLKPPEIGSLDAEVARQLGAYYANPRHTFTVPLRMRGSEYQLRVWREIAAIPSGETCHYQDIAVKLGSVARAVGGACGNNPIPVIVPCHRVLAKNGLGGFNRSTGHETLDIKTWLLRHEGQLL